MLDVHDSVRLTPVYNCLFNQLAGCTVPFFATELETLRLRGRGKTLELLDCPPWAIHSIRLAFRTEMLSELIELFRSLGFTQESVLDTRRDPSAGTQPSSTELTFVASYPLPFEVKVETVRVEVSLLDGAQFDQMYRRSDTFRYGMNRFQVMCVRDAMQCLQDDFEGSPYLLQDVLNSLHDTFVSDSIIF